MFFDIVLLNPQHRGQFGKAWIAATRGIKYLTKADVERVDIVKLCSYFNEYIQSNSRSPQKRFSLKLSAIVLNGTVKILREQVIMVEAEIYKILQTVKFTPIPGEPTKTKKSKKDKRVVKTSGDEYLKSLEVQRGRKVLREIQPLLLDNDRVTIREVTSIATGQDDDLCKLDFVEDLNDILKVPQEIQLPTSASSSDPAEAQIITVVAQVHYDKDRDQQFQKSRELSSIEKRKPSIEKPSTAMEEIVSEVQPQPIEKVSTSSNLMDAVYQAPIKITEITRAAIYEDISKSVKKKSKTSNIYFGRVINRNIRIDRCMPHEIFFINKFIPTPDVYRNPDSALYSTIQIKDDIVDTFLKFRCSSHLSGSSSKRSTLLGEVERIDHSSELSSTAQRSGLELRKSSIEKEPLIQRESDEKLRQVSIDAQFPNILTPRKRLRPFDEPDLLGLQEPMFQPSSIIEELHSVEEPAIVSTSIIREVQPLQKPVIQTLKQIEKKLPTLSDNKKRQQDIINIIVKWNFRKNFPTIQDIAQKPINKLHIARAFSDLLVLAASKFIVLEPEEGSNELKFIKKGPKLLLN